MPMIEDRFLRLKQILGDPKANPPILPLLPIGKSTWYAGVKSGRFPKPLKLSPRTVVWRESEIKALIDRLTHAEPPR